MALTEFDRNLLNRCLAEEPKAWQDFVDRFIGLFVHVINHVARMRGVHLTPADVDDCCAQIFTALLDNQFAILRRFRGKSSLATYLTVVARRIVVRKIGLQRKSPENSIPPNTVYSQALTPAQTCIRTRDFSSVPVGS